MGDGCASAPPGLLPPPWRRGSCPPATSWAAGRDVPATPRILAMVSLGWRLKAARSVGLYMALGHFMQVLFCGTSCPLCHPPTARGPGEALQAPVEVSVLLREARSTRRCHPQLPQSSACPLNHNKEIQTMCRAREFRTSPSPQPAMKVWPRRGNAKTKHSGEQ